MADHNDWADDRYRRRDADDSATFDGPYGRRGPRYRADEDDFAATRRRRAAFDEDYAPSGYEEERRFGAGRPYNHARWLAEQEEARGGGRHKGRGPSDYVRSDERIHEDVNEKLADDGWLDASDIRVKVSNAEVTLGGLVGSRLDKRRAEAIADAVFGVKHTQNNLRVRDASTAKPGDEHFKPEKADRDLDERIRRDN